MSKLKAISGNEIREDIDYNTRGIDPENKEWRNYGKELCYTLYYRKSEADKVIAELKEELKHLDANLAGFLELETECGGGDLGKYIAKLRSENNELFTAKGCLKGTIESLQKIVSEKVKKIRHQKYKRCLAMAILSLEKREFYRAEYEEWCLKWYKRWLKIAEQFKDKEAK